MEKVIRWKEVRYMQRGKLMGTWEDPVTRRKRHEVEITYLLVLWTTMHQIPNGLDAWYEDVIQTLGTAMGPNNASEAEYIPTKELCQRVIGKLQRDTTVERIERHKKATQTLETILRKLDHSLLDEESFRRNVWDYVTMEWWEDAKE